MTETADIAWNWAPSHFVASDLDGDDIHVFAHFSKVKSGTPIHGSAKVSLSSIPGWAIEIEFAPLSVGEPLADLTIERIEITKTDPLAQNADIVRRLSLTRLYRLIEATALHHTIIEGDMPWLDGFKMLPRPGRKGRDDVEYAKYAAEYVSLVEDGNRSPTKTLAETHHKSADSIRAILHAARQRDLLTAAPKGRAGGRLTKKAVQLLGEGPR